MINICISREGKYVRHSNILVAKLGEPQLFSSDMVAFRIAPWTGLNLSIVNRYVWAF